jgi:ABC-type transporter Mla MlaB component
MLKITLHRNETPARMSLEGKLAGPWVDEARKAWRSLPRPEAGSFVVDLSGISYLDAAGKNLLATMWLEGAKLKATGCCTKFIVEEITKGSREPA